MKVFHLFFPKSFCFIGLWANLLSWWLSKFDSLIFSSKSYIWFPLAVILGRRGGKTSTLHSLQTGQLPEDFNSQNIARLAEGLYEMQSINLGIFPHLRRIFFPHFFKECYHDSFFLNWKAPNIVVFSHRKTTLAS